MKHDPMKQWIISEKQTQTFPNHPVLQSIPPGLVAPVIHRAPGWKMDELHRDMSEIRIFHFPNFLEIKS